MNYDCKLNLTVIPKPPSEANVDIVQRIKNSLLGKIYSLTIKKNSYTRNCSIFLWKNMYPFFLKVRFFLLSRNMRIKNTKKLVHFSALDSLSVKQTRLFLPSIAVQTPIPNVFPKAKQALISSLHEQYIFPEISVYEIHDAKIVGGSNLIVKDDLILCHDLIDFQKDYTSEELHGRLYINGKKNLAAFINNDSKPIQISCAATFVDACASNYAHWITEVLPKINLFCGLAQFKTVPIIVNSDLHLNILASLSLTVDEQREIICLPVGRMINVQKLYALSAVGYVPFERRRRKVQSSSHGFFSPDAFQLLRQKIHALSLVKYGDNYSEKIYLRRNAQIRNVLNFDEVESFFLSKGFKIIEPENLSFQEQVSIFSHAKIIVGATGAAFANIIFCQKNTRIVIFLPEIIETYFFYWQNLACTTGNTVEYILGTARNRSSGVHSNYYISPADLSGFD